MGFEPLTVREKCILYRRPYHLSYLYLTIFDHLSLYTGVVFVKTPMFPEAIFRNEKKCENMIIERFNVR